MVEEKKLEELSENEKRVVKALENLGKADVEEVCSATNLSKDEVENASLWAKAKGVVEQEEEVLTFFELTDEGEEYSSKGLPEKNLIKQVNSGVKEISKIKEKLEKADIGVVWAKKYGWISIDKGKVELTNEGKKPLNQETEGEKLLKIFVAPEKKEERKLRADEIKASEKYVEDFIKRGLIKKTEKIRRKLFLTKLGKEMAPKLEVTGEEIGQLTPEIIRSGKWKEKKLRKYNLSLPAPKIEPAKIHPYRQVIDEVRERLIALGFVEARGPFIELNFWNSDALFMPQDHPARDIHDIFYVKEPKYGKILNEELLKKIEKTHENGWITKSKGWGGKFSLDVSRRLLLRSHCTAVSARCLASLKEGDVPYKMFVIDRCFRPDVIDAQHFIEFEHCDGIVVGEKLNLMNLLGYLEEIASIAGAEKVRFRPSYFPFTEPSVEGQAYYKELGWVEFGGAGIFRPEVTLPLGIKVPVLAWGLGIGRLAMIKLSIKDIRMLYSDDLGWLRGRAIVR